MVSKKRKCRSISPSPYFCSMAALQAPLHFLGFTAQHGGLVRHPDGLQMKVRIEALRIGPFEFL